MSTLKLVEPSQMAFNYDLVAAPIAIQAREAAERIRLRLRRSAEDIIEIGLDLIAVKASIGHGNFLPWIEAEFGMTARTAQKFMGVAQSYGSKSELYSHLDASALYELAAPKTPIEVREEVERMIEAGEVVAAATVKELRSKLVGLEKAKMLAEEEIEQKAAKVSELEESINTAVSAEIEKAAKRIAKGYEDEIARLKREVLDLRKPKPTTTIDHETGNVVSFGKPLSDVEAASIDAETDDFIEADFNEVASAEDRATVFVGCVRSINSLNASPEAIYSRLTKDRSEKAIAEHMAMVDQALSLLQAVKDQHNG